MKLLFLGDSITDGGHCFTPDNLGNGFVKDIVLSLRSSSDISGRQPDDPHPLSVTNGGADGFTFPRILYNWKLNYQEDRWDTAVISGGINEVGYLADAAFSEEQARQYLENSMTALRELVFSMREKQMHVIVLEPFLFPVPDCRIRWLPCLNRMKRMMRAVTEEASLSSAGPPVHFLAAQPALDDLARLRGYAAVTADGIHLTDAGNRCLAGLVLPYLL